MGRRDAKASTGWEILGAGCAEGITLALDFDAVGRPEACFAELMPMLNPVRETWRAVQPQAADGVAPASSAYLEFWSSSLRERGTVIHAVLGFCAGALFAAALAERITQWQPAAPAVVLLDPERPTAATLIRQFDNAMRGLAAVTSSAEVAGAREAAGRLSDEPDLQLISSRLTALYGEVSKPAFTRLGLKPAFQDDLIASYEQLMSYLVAAAGTQPAPGLAAASTISSITPPCQSQTAVSWVAAGVDHAGLLRSPAVAAKVSELLGQ